MNLEIDKLDVDIIIIEVLVLFEIQDFQECSGRTPMQIALSNFVNFVKKSQHTRLDRALER